MTQSPASNAGPGVQQSVPMKGSQLPVQPHERIQFIDILRGFALLGVLLANMIDYSGYAGSLDGWSDSLDKLILLLLLFLVRGKFYTLFSFLFGWGLSVQMGRAAAKGHRLGPTFIRRLLILLLIGVLHGVFIWRGDILAIYALLGFLLFAVRNRSQRFLLAAAAICLLLVIGLSLPLEPVTQMRQWVRELSDGMASNLPESIYQDGSYWDITRKRAADFIRGDINVIFSLGSVLAMFLLGLAAGKRRVFQQIGDRLGWVRLTALFSLLFGLLLNGIIIGREVAPGWLPAAYDYQIAIVSRTFGGPALALFYLCAIILLSRSRYWLERLRPIGNLGRMALTNYLLQSVMATAVFYSYGLGLYGQTDPSFGVIVTVLIYLIEIRFSGWWLAKYQFGPVEWVWRWLSYGRRPPLRQGESYQTTTPNRLLARLRRVPLAIRLGGSWLVLLLWGFGLFQWYQSFDIPVPSLISGGAAAAVQTVVPTRVGAAGSEATFPLATPQVNPVPYAPTDLILTGSMDALAASFNAEAALDQIKMLTSPPYLGRLAGSPGGKAAGDAIAKEFAQLRLQPAGDSGTFFQSFPISYTTLAAVPELRVTLPGGASQEYVLYEDFAPIIRDYAGEGAGSGEVVWVNRCSHTDFGRVPLTGAVAFCQTGLGSSDIQAASREAVEQGAAGLLLLTDPELRAADFSDRFTHPWIPETIPTMRVFPELAEALLTGSGHTIESLLALEETVPLQSQVSITVDTTGYEACPSEGCIARNVLGVLPGRDPAFAHEVVILSAHYDHMGEGPDGTAWVGANDDASGVAVILEIARSWQAQGYVPRRTVLFAAWDAEEWGLVGSRYYVQFPKYPLSDIVGVIQLDMVGAGDDVLFTTGSAELTAELLAIGARLPVDMGQTGMGRSDHAPFMDAGVPAAALIWLDEAGNTPFHYHRPLDTVELIELDKLQAVGQLTTAAALNLAESEPAIMTMLAARGEAAASGDLAAFIATSAPDQSGVDTGWFNDLQSFQPMTVTFNAGDLQVMGDTASGEVTIEAVYPGSDSSQPVVRSSSQLAAQFQRKDGQWQWGGPDLAWTEAAGIQIGYPSSVETPPTGVGEQFREEYLRLAEQLGLAGDTGLRLELLPSSGAIRASAGLSLAREQSMWVDRGIVKLVYSARLTESVQLSDAAVQLLLANQGVSQESAGWLWLGLPLLWQAQANSIEVQSAFLPPLARALAAAQPIPDRAAAWAAADYLLEQVGWQGIGRLIVELGQSDLDTALAGTAGLSVDGFDLEWRSTWENRLVSVQARLDSLLEKRTEAILDQDEGTFLATADPTIPGLLSSQRHWLADLHQHPLDYFSQTALPLALMGDGSVLAQVDFEYQLSGRGPSKAQTPLLFTAAGDGYLWAGKRLLELPGETVVVAYPEGEAELAGALRQKAVEWTVQLAAMLNIIPSPVRVELYDGSDDFRAVVSLAYPPSDWADAWTGEGQPIKLRLLPTRNEGDYNAPLATQLIRQLLSQSGVAEEWLLNGLSSYLSYTFDGGVTQKGISSQWAAMTAAAAEGGLLTLERLPVDIDLTRADSAMAKVQAWDAIRYLVHSYGWDSLIQLCQGETFAAVTGKPEAVFMQEWATSLMSAHVREGWLEQVSQFDAQAALEQASRLADPRLGGRLAGSEGADQAAELIAAQFQRYGLAAAGDDGRFIQTVPITISELIGTPVLDVLAPDGEAAALQYRDHFLPVRPTLEGDAVTGELFLMQPESSFEGADFEGGILVRRPELSIGEEISRAVEHNAGALLLIGFKKEPAEIYGKLPDATFTSSPIPVLELTMKGYEQLLEYLGLDRTRASRLPPLHRFGVDAAVYFSVSQPRPGSTSNVLGLLPGSDPALARETIILGAHYDHVGDDPDGRQYSGLNDNASGVAVMLEIARLWQAIGYQPQRSILFAAWGGQELGNLGSAHYRQQPTRPLTSTIAMIQLDGLGGGEGFALGSQGDPEQDGLLLSGLEMMTTLLEEKLVTTAKVTESDHFAFAGTPFPSLLVSWRLAGEDNLPDEYARSVSPERLGVSGRATALLLMSLAQ